MQKDNIFITRSLILAACFLAVSSFVFYLPYKVICNNTIDSVNERQLLLAQQAALRIQDFFLHYERILVHLAIHDEIIKLDDAGKKLIEELYHTSHDDISAISRIDATGRILYTFPYNQDLIGRDISGQEHNRLIIENHKPLVSDVFTALQGFRTIAYAIPIFDKGIYAGSLSLLIPFEVISQRFLADIVLGKDGYAWMINKKGTELYCPVPGHTGKTVAETSARFPSVIEMAEKMMKGEQGHTSYNYDRIKDRHTRILPKQAAYYPVEIPGNLWSVVVETPESQILKAVNDFGKWWLAIFCVFVGTILFYLTFFVRSRLIAGEKKKRLLTEEKLRKNDRLFSRFINNAHIPVVMVKMNGTIEFLNDEFQELCGYTLEDIPTIDQWFSKAYPDEKLREEINRAWETKLKKAIKNDTAVTFKERTITCKDGSERDVVFVYTLIDARVVITFHDNTEQNRIKKTEQELLHRQTRTKKMEAIGLMAGGVAHDLNNILSGIVSYPELLLLQLPEDSELRKPISAIQESGQRAAAVVADLLTVARGVASARETSNLNTLIQQYLDSPEHKKVESLHGNISCRAQLEPELANISCSPVHIKKCLMNLITNAAEAVDTEGAVVISTRNQTVEKPTGNTLHIAKGQYVVLSVKDTGSGIAEKDLDHIFEPFYTKKIMGRSGTGLGLSVVWNTVQDHDGTITVTSSKDGTTFELYFPISDEEITVEETGTEIKQLKGNGERILIIDDEPQQRDIASQMLISLGYEVNAVASGEKAIEYLKENSVDLLLLDMVMDPGLNGRETYERIIKIIPGQKAVIASGFSENNNVQKTLQLGAGGFIKKPYSMEELAKAVKFELGK
ncbi:MAG: response regulator [Patescibacteria group bacterium]|nr:response regulator [Patescibacteria group bacterium]